MARYRLSDPAKADISSILRTSESRFGIEARLRYRGLLAEAFRRIANDPTDPVTADRSQLVVGLRSLHLRHARKDSQEARVAAPSHLVYYRALTPGLVEIVRVLHERMEPARHLVPKSAPSDEPGQ